jgi:hypothetical protein
VLARNHKLVASLCSFEEIEKAQFLKLLHYGGVECRCFSLIFLDKLGSEFLRYEGILNCHC